MKFMVKSIWSFFPLPWFFPIPGLWWLVCRISCVLVVERQTSPEQLVFTQVQTHSSYCSIFEITWYTLHYIIITGAASSWGKVFWSFLEFVLFIRVQQLLGYLTNCLVAREMTLHQQSQNQNLHINLLPPMEYLKHLMELHSHHMLHLNLLIKSHLINLLIKHQNLHIKLNLPTRHPNPPIEFQPQHIKPLNPPCKLLQYNRV